MMETLRTLLQNEDFPQMYTHKFIGDNTESFLAQVRALHARFLHLSISIQSRISRKGDFIAYTFTFMASSPDDIIPIVEETSKLSGLKILL